MVMPASDADQGEHFALQLLRAGFSVIPLDPNSKAPSKVHLYKGHWGSYQIKKANEEQMLGWLRDDHNWGVICGEISGGLYCGDIDDVAFSQWVLDDPRRPIFQGACIVRSGSGKAHVWFVCPEKILSTHWYLGDGSRGFVGQIRGDGRPGTGGSYMVVPPSIHPDTGQRYEVVAGSLLHLPVITDGKKFLAEILRDYRGDPTVKFVEPDAQHTSKTILVLDDAEKQLIVSRVRQLKLPKRYVDTLLTDGCQTPTSPTWQRALTDKAKSGSEIDYAVVCRLIEKNESFDDIERIFAASLLGPYCYANDKRPNHGRAYLWATYQAALRDVEKSKQMARVAAGDNFRVTRAVRVNLGPDQAEYKLDIVLIDSIDRSEKLYESIVLTDDDLSAERKARDAVFRKARITLYFNAGHQGTKFHKFREAVEGMVLEQEYALPVYTRPGHIASMVLPRLQRLATRVPNSPDEIRGLGWDNGDGTITVMATRLFMYIDSVDRGISAGRQILDALGEWREQVHRWGSGEHDPTFVIRLRRP